MSLNLDQLKIVGHFKANEVHMIRFKSTEIFESVKHFHDEIRECHEKAHGKAYTAQHDAIIKYGSECETYRELGIMQGATAAAAVVAGFKDLHLIDIDLKNFNEFKPIFEKENIKMKVDGKSSLSYRSEDLPEVDFLLIDSLHVPGHLKQELKIHAPRVKKYILFHDTFSKTSLHKEVLFYIKTRPQWEVVEYYEKNVGYTLIKRISDE